MRGMAAARRERQATQATAARRATMWSFRGGLRVLVEALTAALRTPPLVGVGVRRLARDADGWRVHAEGRDAWPADAVVLACPARQQAEVLAELDSELAERIAGIAYNRIAVVGLGYRRADVAHTLDGFGYLSPQKTRRDVLGVQWCSSIYPGERAPHDAVLLRALCGGWHRGDIVEWPDDRLTTAVHAELAQALGVRGRPIFQQVVRWSPAIPQYFVGHGERVAWIDARSAGYPGLFLGGSAYRGVAINDCVEQAGLLAGRVAAWLRRVG
jgi:oxygen-dependent protoporphyrinogen oxidase